ncbi:hypothetical protein ACPV5O_26520 [Vibrio maritimus]|jgi:hypothetical protein|uniref:hypothetical protein n=1 Tax=Vibrio maritimus TaxID=990268 RepID=UPI004069235B
MKDVIDYTDCFEGSLLAQGKERNFLALYRCNPQKRNDGKVGTFELLYRSLSADCQHERDEAWCLVQYAEVNIFQKKEIGALLKELSSDTEVSLFDHFDLW